MKVYGKDRELDRRELNITAQTELAFVVDGVAKSVTVLVQPESEQDCLVGMNAIQKLGIQLLRSNGTSICAENSLSTKSSVRLLQACTIPGRKGRFLDVTIDGKSDDGAQVIFEPDNQALKGLAVTHS